MSSTDKILRFLPGISGAAQELVRVVLACTPCEAHTGLFNQLLDVVTASGNDDRPGYGDAPGGGAPRGRDGRAGPIPGSRAPGVNSAERVGVRQNIAAAHPPSFHDLGFNFS